MINKIKKKFTNCSGYNKEIIINIIGTFVIKGIALVLSLFTMPAYISFFNNNVVLGLWFTLLSVLNWILTFDLGVGNGLRNYLTKAITRKNHKEAKTYLSSAYISIGIFSLVIIILFLLISNQFDWNALFNINKNIVSATALDISIKIVFIGIMIQFLLRLITSVLYALQKAFLTNLLSLITTIITLIFVFILPSKNNNYNIILMSIIHVIAAVLPYLICSFIIFIKKPMRDMKPSIKYFDKNHMRKVLDLGGRFFFVQITYMLIIGTNEIFITKLAGNNNVVHYQIYNKFFVLGCTLFSLALAPVWSAVTKAIVEKKYDWIKKIYKKLILAAILGSICEILMIPFLQFIINIWLGDNAINISYFNAFIFAILGSLMIFNSVFSSIANGAGKLKVQVICFAIGAFLKIILSIIFVKVLGNWIGVILATALALLIYCVIQPIFINKLFDNEFCDNTR